MIKMSFLVISLLAAGLILFYIAAAYSLFLVRMIDFFSFERIGDLFRKKGVSKMMIPQKLTRFLKRHKVYYQVLVHPKSFTSPETAHAGHIHGKSLAKVVMVKADGKNAMVVLPSTRTVDLFKLSMAMGTRDVHIEEEKEFKDLFEDCEVGAMPPFGQIYHVPCYLDQSLSESGHLFFNAGNHEECIEIETEDFLRIVKGVTADLSVEGKKIHEKQKVAV